MSDKKILFWFGALLSLPAAGYAITIALYNGWLNAYDSKAYPEYQASIWFWGMLVIVVLLFVLFVYCVESLKKPDVLNPANEVKE